VVSAEFTTPNVHYIVECVLQGLGRPLTSLHDVELQLTRDLLLPVQFISHLIYLISQLLLVLFVIPSPINCITNLLLHRCDFLVASINLSVQVLVLLLHHGNIIIQSVLVAAEDFHKTIKFSQIIVSLHEIIA